MANNITEPDVLFSVFKRKEFCIRDIFYKLKLPPDLVLFINKNPNNRHYGNFINQFIKNKGRTGFAYGNLLNQPNILNFIYDIKNNDYINIYIISYKNTNGAYLFKNNEYLTDAILNGIILSHTKEFIRNGQKISQEYSITLNDIKQSKRFIIQFIKESSFLDIDFVKKQKDSYYNETKTEIIRPILLKNHLYKKIEELGQEKRLEIINELYSEIIKLIN